MFKLHSRVGTFANLLGVVGMGVMLGGTSCASKPEQSRPQSEAQAGTGGVGGIDGTGAGGLAKPTGGDAAGGDAATGAGAGGEGDDHSTPGDSGEELGASCSRAGDLGCAGNHQKLKLVCGAAGVWESNGTCGQGEFCQTAVGVDEGICLAEAEECQGLDPGASVCTDGELRKCGVDSLNSELVQQCQYGCAGDNCAVDPPCDTGKGDCTDAPGCETNLKFSAENCGVCGNSCVGAPNTTDSCSAGACTCKSGFSDCTSAPGCETATITDVQHCGTCDNACTFGACVGGKCAVRVFVTSTTYLGNLGGLDGADQKCQQQADASGLSGTFKAWLSDSTTPVSSRMPHHDGPYVRLDSKVIATGWTALTTTSHQEAISVDEHGEAVELSYVWTGGDPARQKPYFCEDWTSATESTFGYCGQTGLNGWDHSAFRVCSMEMARLYCFEVPSGQ